jgi:hypothetical protein
VIDATTAGFAEGDRHREEAARKSQREAVDREARELKPPRQMPRLPRRSSLW